MNRRNYGVTFLELLISIILLSVIVLGFSNIEIFSRFHVVTADRRSQVQNEVSYVLEHMTKNISQAIGNVSRFGVDVRANKQQIRVRWDRNSNGQADDADDASPPGWISYLYNPGNHRVTYVSDYRPGYPPPAPWPGMGGEEIISNKITSCDFDYNATDNFVRVEITGRYDPASAATSDNPSVTMNTIVNMPSVSVN